MPSSSSPSFHAFGAFWRLTLTTAAIALSVGACASEPLPSIEPPPLGGAGTPQGCAADNMPDDALVGKPEAEAIKLLTGCPWRVGQRDAHQYPGTMDFVQERRTLGIAGGIVVWVKRG